MNDRMERLKSDAAALNVGKGAKRDGLFQTLGEVAMGVGVVLALVAYMLSLGKDDTRDIESLQILAVAMLTLAVVGGVVYLRYSLGRFLRFWLLRQLYEGQAHIDQVVEAVVAAPTAGGRAGDRAGSTPAGERVSD
jgi:hypothetical protein